MEQAIKIGRYILKLTLKKHLPNALDFLLFFTFFLELKPTLNFRFGSYGVNIVETSFISLQFKIRYSK